MTFITSDNVTASVMDLTSNLSHTSGGDPNAMPPMMDYRPTRVCDNITQHVLNEVFNCVAPYFLMTDPGFNPFTVTVYGYVSPLLVLLTVATNTLVSVVLLKKNMRNATNTLLVAMAISDMLTGIWPIPGFIHFFTLGNYEDLVPYNWCFVYDLLFETLPIIFHTASIWLTVALAVQRYIFVCHSLKAKRWCTIPNVIKVIFGVYVAAIVCQLTRFMDQEYKPVQVQSLLHKGVMMTGCTRELRSVFSENVDIYYNFYYWIRIVFIHLLPCTFLVVLNALLICAMRSAQRRREQLLKQNRRSESRRMKESNCTTLMLVAVVGLFLLVEFPLGVLMTLVTIDNTFETSLNTEDNSLMPIYSIASLFINLCILLSYPLNFFIYCGMSRQFRDTFWRLFVPGVAPPDREHSQYISLATENGRGKSETTACNNEKTATAVTSI